MATEEDMPALARELMAPKSGGAMSRMRGMPDPAEPDDDDVTDKGKSIEVDDSFINAARAVRQAKSDEEYAQALKGAIKLCLGEEGY